MKGYAGSTTPESERDEYCTPKFVHAWARYKLIPYGLGTSNISNFTVDVAAREHNSLCKWFMPDAFAEPWDGRYGMYGWCNPPYSNIEGWVRQAIESTAYGFSTVMLIPSLNGAAHDELVLKYAVRVVFIVGRLSFIDADGNPKGGNNRGSIFAAFSPEKCETKYTHVRRDYMEKWYESNRRDIKWP